MKTLYQYTSLNALAMILKNQEIRFSNLCLMDDPLEQFVRIYDYDTKDRHLTYIRKNYGKYCFVSCWTDDEKESIAMWDMYGDRKQGVRISMPQDMFDENFDINAEKKRTRGLFDIKQEIVQPQLIKVDYDRLDTPEIVTRG